MPSFRSPLAALTLAAALTCSAMPAFAVDSPSLDVTGASRTSLTLEVLAGESGAPSGFTVEWMLGSNFDLLGGFPAEPGSPVVRSARFVGSPTLNTLDGTRPGDGSEPSGVFR